MSGKLELADWRRATAEMYAEARRRAEDDPKAAWAAWSRTRDELFRGHPASPLGAAERSSFGGLAYYPYDPAWRFVAPVLPLEAEREARDVVLPEGELRYRAVGSIEVASRSGRETEHLALYWIDGYGGGLFLPFGDATNGTTSYGGGRYLYDTIKGADLGAGPEEIVLDFNFAYHPSCAYDPRWVCPLAPRENRLSFAVEAGERIASS